MNEKCLEIVQELTKSLTEDQGEKNPAERLSDLRFF